MPEREVRMAAQLYEARDAARKLHGDLYASKMAEYGSAIQEVARRTGLTDMQTAVRMAQGEQDDGRAYTAVTILAAMVELVEPSTAEHGGQRAPHPRREDG